MGDNICKPFFLRRVTIFLLIWAKYLQFDNFMKDGDQYWSATRFLQVETNVSKSASLLIYLIFIEPYYFLTYCRLYIRFQALFTFQKTCLAFVVLNQGTRNPHGPSWAQKGINGQTQIQNPVRGQSDIWFQRNIFIPLVKP